LYESLQSHNRTHYMKLRRDSILKVESNHFSLVGLLTSSRQKCAHVSDFSPDKLNSFNEMVAKKERMKNEKNGNIETIRKGSGDKTRAEILQSALGKARPSAKARMRFVIDEYQQEDVLLECPIC